MQQMSFGKSIKNTYYFLFLAAKQGNILTEIGSEPSHTDCAGGC